MGSRSSSGSLAWYVRCEKISIFRVLPACLLLLLGAAAADGGVLPARRRSQFQSEPGYAVLPYLYSLPGIGWGYGILGAATNVGHSYTDIAGTVFLGDADGQAISVDSVHLVDRTLILDLGVIRLSRATLQSFAKRGMASGRDDYTLAEFGDMYFGGSRLTATFDERRFEAFVGYYTGTARLKALRDRGGGVIIESSNAPTYRITTTIVGGRLDLTDDSIDPRRGLRFEPSVWRSPRRAEGPDYYFDDLSLTAYLPVGRRSTWAFNFLRSDAHVLNKSETDPAALGRQHGLDCAAIVDPGARAECRSYLDTMAAQNSLGTATGLGGIQRLRSYPEGRYKGAHAEFFGAELRWNLTDEIKPFDIYIMKDIRTAVQVAFFYEAGSVADSRGELWRVVRSSYGSGVRIVTASGLVYRLDLAGGDEGFQPSVFFQYPWEL